MCIAAESVCEAGGSLVDGFLMLPGSDVVLDNKAAMSELCALQYM